MERIKFAFFALFLMLLPYTSNAAPLDYWNWRNPLPQGNKLLEIKYLNGMFVAVGLNGAIVTSPDGTNWTAQNSGTDASIEDISYGNGLFVATGWLGKIITSPDGKVWTVRQSSNVLTRITFANGFFIATGRNYGTAIVYTSVNGTDWTLTNVDGYASIRGITFGNGIYIAIGTNYIDGHTSNRILFSRDGKTWATAPAPETFQFESSMLYANGLFHIWGLAKVDGVFVRRLYTSSDGLNWTEQGVDTFGLIYEVSFGNGIFVAVKDFDRIVTSTNGLSWLDMPAIAHVTTYGNGVFAAVLGSQMLTSVDGMNWTFHESKVTDHDLRDVTYGNSIFVAVGISYSSPLDNYIIASREGTNWMVIPTQSHPLNRVAFFNNTFIALGFQGDLLSSSDGLHWGNRTTGTTNHLVDVAYGNNIFAVVGNGTILTSSDGISWVGRDPRSLVNFTDIIFANGIFVAEGGIEDDSYVCYFPECPPHSFGTIFTSADGLEWTQRYLDERYSSFHPIEYRDSKFIIYDWLNDNRVLTSSDGINWTAGDASVLLPKCTPWADIGIPKIHSITFGNDTFLAVGSDGIILQSNFLGGACAATLNPDLTLHVPIINFNGRYLWGDAVCEARPDSVMCRVAEYGEANPDAFSDCQASTLSSDFALHVPAGIYNNISYSADFEFVRSADGQRWFKLSSYCRY